MSQLVTIFGGSGFVGRYIARRMANAGWRVRVATRRPTDAVFVKPYGSVGQVEPVACNIRDDASVAAAMQGADAVVNCVGILTESGANKFDAVHTEGAERVARIAAAQQIGRLVQISAIGADPEGASIYSRTKAAGEAAVLAHCPEAIILRPSVIFGTEDAFFNRFAGLTRFSPVLPLPGAATRFQPVWVDDVAQAAEVALCGHAAPGTYELGGPDVRTLRELIGIMLTTIRRRRAVLALPGPIAGLVAWGFDMVQAVTFGLIANPVITRDQLRSLGTDNVVAEDARGFADLGIEPTGMEAVLPDYLWRFRPAGQYNDIQKSARKIKI